MRKLILLLALLLMAGQAMGQAVYVPPTALQAETQAYYARIVAAGGTIDGATLQAIDRFIQRGKAEGWFSSIKQAWCPVGDFTASKVFLVTPSGITPTFNNFVAADYAQETGYTLTANTNKYVDTGFTPNSNGVTYNNLSLGMCCLSDVAQNGFAYLMGCTPPTNTNPPAPYIDPADGLYGQSNALTSTSCNYGGEGSVFASHFGTTAYGSAEDGVLEESYTYTPTSVAFDSNITLFRSQRENATIYYATGGMGFYFIGTNSSDSLCQLITNAIERLETDIGRSVFKKPIMEAFGDSITSGAGGTTGYHQARRWSKLFAKSLGYRERNTSQGNSQLTLTALQYVGGISRYTPLLDGKSGIVALLYGTNDMDIADSATNGTSTLATTYQNNYSALIAAFQSANKKVLVGGVPPNTTANSTKTLLYVAAGAAASRANNATFVDLYDALMDTGSYSTYLSDGLHPTDAGHAIYAEYYGYGNRGLAVRKPTLDFPSLAAGASADLTVTMYGADVGMSVSLGLPSTIESGLTFNAFVSAQDTVTVRCTNASTSTIDSASQKYRVTVLLAR